MNKTEKSILAACVCGLLFTGWQWNNFYRYLNATYNKAQMCDKTNCETLIATSEMVDMRPPKMMLDKNKK